jgi:replication factor A2
MSHFDPYNDNTGYSGYNNPSSGGHLDGGFENGGNNSQFSTSQGKPSYAKQFIVPVTIKMLNEASVQGGHDGSFYSHGVELSYVRFIGVIREVDTQNETHTMYKLEDGTGVTNVRVWNNDSSLDEDFTAKDETGFKPSPFSTTDYVEVVATIKEFNNKIQIQTQRFAKIKDFNSVTYHLLNVAKNYLVKKNGDSVLSLSDNKDNIKGESLFVSENGNNNGNSNNAAQSLPDRLLEFIKNHSQTMSDGVPMQFMAHEMNLPMDQVETGISELVEEGRIFSTSDDTQFLPL